MSALLEEVAPGVFRAAKREASGWEQAMHVLRLEGGSLLVHSATRLGGEAMEELRALGEVRWLLAPNHFHHLGLSAYREAFPEARVVASATATRRLRAKGYDVTPLADVDLGLPAGASVLVAEGTKNGEVVVSWPTPGGRLWIVCDAFFNVPSLRGATGVLLRALGVGPGLAIGRTFHWVGIDDRRVYRAWLERALEQEAPDALSFSHGESLAHGRSALAALARGL